MRKCKVLRVLLFNLIISVSVPSLSYPACDFPDPNPISFALANLVCYPDYLLIEDRSPPSWNLMSGVARLYGLTELQPFTVRGSGPALKGWLILAGNGIAVNQYHDYTLQLGYGRELTGSVSGEASLALSQIGIKTYGTAHAWQLNARFTWQVQPQVQISTAAFNLNNARFGDGHYALPTRYVIAGKLTPGKSAQFFLELEKDLRYPLQVRFGLGYHVFGPLTFLCGFQSEPDIVSAGFSLKASRFLATASMQYHPELGYSQCCGLAIAL
jgi:hypothetical protein